MRKQIDSTRMRKKIMNPKLLILLKNFILCVLLVFLSNRELSAQSTTSLQVSLMAGKNDTLNNIVLQLYLLPDTSLVHSKIVNHNPVSFTVNQFSRYILRVSDPGFESADRLVAVNEKPVVISLAVRKTAENDHLEALFQN